MNSTHKIIVGIVVAFAGAVTILLILPAAISVYAWAGWSGRFLIVAYIGFLGGIGGLLSAARDGVLYLPRFDSNGDLELGMVQEIAFGFVGGIVVFLLVPSMSDKAVEMGRAAVEEASLAGSYIPFARKDVEWPRDLDWIELVSLSLVGGYGGRALISKALSGLTKEQVERSIKREAAEIETQYRNDQEAWNLVADQVDVFTNPPAPHRVRDGLAKASEVARRQAYIQTRAQCHLYLMNAAQLADPQARNELLTKVANRVLPIIETLRQLDSARQYRGSRFLAALCKYLVSDWDAASNLLSEALSISRDLKRPVPEQYVLLEQALKERKSCDAGFLMTLVQTTDEA